MLLVRPEHPLSLRVQAERRCANFSVLLARRIEQRVFDRGCISRAAVTDRLLAQALFANVQVWPQRFARSTLDNFIIRIFIERFPHSSPGPAARSG